MVGLVKTKNRSKNSGALRVRNFYSIHIYY